MRSLLIVSSLFVLWSTLAPMTVLASVNLLLVDAVVPIGNPTVSYVNGSVVSGQLILSQSYLVNTTQGLSTGLFLWVSVQNSAGQTVAVYLGSVTPPGDGQNFSVSAILLDLPGGCCNYVAEVFVTTITGIPISKTTSAPVPPVIPV